MSTELSKPQSDFRSWMSQDNVKAELARAFRGQIKPEMISRIVLTAAVRNPAIAECTRESVWLSLLQCGERGLVPDGREAALVPYRDNRRGGIRVCQFQPMYQGLVKLASNAGVTVLPPVNVYANEKFKVQYGATPPIVHEPLPPSKRGEFVACYSIAIVNGVAVPDFMWAEDIDKTRDRSKAKNDGPWVTDTDEMRRKTVFKRHTKYLPQSAELAAAIRDDDAAEFGIEAIGDVEIVTPTASTSRSAKLAEQIRGKTPLPAPAASQPEPPGAAEQPSGEEPVSTEPAAAPATTAAPKPESPVIGGKRASKLTAAISTAAPQLREQILTDYRLSKVTLAAGVAKLTEDQADAIEAMLEPVGASA